MYPNLKINSKWRFFQGFFIFSWFLFCIDTSKAQVGIYPNLTEYPALKKQPEKRAARRTPVNLPFFDDFSTHPTGRINNDLWEDGGGTFVNNEFGIDIPTVRVVTFDGINSLGKPYDFSTFVNNAVGPADTLTSCPINLGMVTPADSLYLSFFWQKGGIGEIPDGVDSLALQFKNTAGAWLTRWLRTGDGQSSGFQYELIPVREDQFFHSGFQFRFRAYGRLSGLYDIWNVDYVYLNRGRNRSDGFVRDLAASGKPNSLLKRYSAMPVDQYFTNPGAETATELSSELNNLNNNFNFYAYRVRLENALNNNLIAELINTSPVIINANQRVKINAPLSPAVLPPSNQALTIRTIFDLSTGDNNTTIPPVDLRRNDTISAITVLKDYYAYDDGTAEYGAGINQRFGRVAVRYLLNRPDTLTDVFIHITKLEKDLSGNTFNLIIWSYIENDKDSILYRTNVPIFYPDSRNEFISVTEIKQKGDPSFRFPPVPVRGTFYVGWEQTTNDRLTVGFDRNNDASSQIFFNVSTQWTPWSAGSSEKGSLMLRPVFALNQVTATENLQNATSFKIYPNPAQNHLNVEGPEIAQIEIWDRNGKMLLSSLPNNTTSTQRIDTSTLPAGFYLIKIYTAKGFFFKKLILQK